MSAYIILILAFLLSFAATFLVTPYFIKKLEEKGFIGTDVNKRRKPKIANFGGLGAVFGLGLGILVSIAYLTATNQNPLPLAATLGTVLLIAFIGLIDDILNIRQIIRASLPALGALPLIAIRAGSTLINTPFGVVDFGVFYYIILAIGVTGASNATNMLAGYNGLEAGLAVIYCSAVLFSALYLQNLPVALLMISMIGASLAFLRYNWYPAKCFPGNVLNYTFGAVLAAGVIMGDMERTGIILITLFIIEFLFKARGRFTPKWWAVEGPRGILKPVTKRIYSLPQFLMSRQKLTEKKLVLELYVLQIIVSIIAVATTVIRW